MFLVEYSILNVSIVKSVTLYSAQPLRSVSTITKRIFVVITALECSMGRAYTMINKGLETTQHLMLLAEEQQTLRRWFATPHLTLQVFISLL